MTKIDTDFTPALGKHELTDSYDRVIALMTREKRWRGRMLTELNPQPGQTIVDIGSGTASFAIMVKTACPEVRLIGIDPDPAVRAIAEQKAAKAGAEIEFVTAMGHDAVVSVEPGSADHVTNSLVLHQCSMDAKMGILASAYDLLKPGGRFLMSDYGNQRTLLMQALFRQVRMVDGFENTKANKDGLIPVFMADAGFEHVEELKVTPTPTGSISLYSGYKPV